MISANISVCIYKYFAALCRHDPVSYLGYDEELDTAVRGSSFQITIKHSFYYRFSYRVFLYLTLILFLSTMTKINVIKRTFVWLLFKTNVKTSTSECQQLSNQSIICATGKRGKRGNNCEVVFQEIRPFQVKHLYCVFSKTVSSSTSLAWFVSFFYWIKTRLPETMMSRGQIRFM